MSKNIQRNEIRAAAQGTHQLWAGSRERYKLVGVAQETVLLLQGLDFRVPGIQLAVPQVRPVHQGPLPPAELIAPAVSLPAPLHVPALKSLQVSHSISFLFFPPVPEGDTHTDCGGEQGQRAGRRITVPLRTQAYLDEGSIDADCLDKI